jgi:hypothetical protein
MQITLLADPDTIEKALQIAERAPTFSGRGLQAPTEDLLGRLESIWEDIRMGLAQAYRQGRQRVAEIAARVHVAIEEKLKLAGDKAEELRRMLLDRLGTYLQGIVDTMLGAVRGQLTVQGMQLKLSELEIAQTVTVSNSLEISLDRVFEFSADGELSVSAKYSATVG